ncbi:hypothetical protein ENUP19_0152G0017 [Entamoeba nuttalli]|uniref:Rab family GTPase n=1 Tax=Entamoeba nuttalli TaxID=412467 RepID=A0ABQ0DL23_9EUKA
MKTITISVGLCGDSGVGKTGIFKRYITGQYTGTEKASVSCDVSCKKLNIEGEAYNLQLWDTAGQEVFRSITASYFRNRHVMCFCFDITKKASFSSISGWLREFQQNQNPSFSTKLILVGCKSDLEGNRQITTTEAEQFAQENKMSYYECSAKTNIGIDQLFNHAISLVRNGEIPLDQLSTRRNTVASTIHENQPRTSNVNNITRTAFYQKQSQSQQLDASQSVNLNQPPTSQSQFSSCC